MRKAEMTIYGLIELLIVVLTLGVLILVVTGLYKPLINNLSKEQVCQASFYASSLSKAVTVVGNPTINPECKTNRITIVEDTKDAGDTESGGVKKALSKNYRSPFAPTFDDTYTRVAGFNDGAGKTLKKNLYPYIDECKDKGTEEKRKECVVKRYNMDYIVADEMKRCWVNVANGKLPLFDQWYEFIDCNKDKPGIQKCNNLGEWITNNKGTVVAAKFCVLCSRIKFDGEVGKEFPSSYDSINIWMANNPWQISHQTSYYEYIVDDNLKKSYFTTPKFSYSPSEPYAVAFVRVNMNGGASLTLATYEFGKNTLDYMFQYKNADKNNPVYYANAMVLVPYRDLPKTCDYIVGSYT